MAAVQIETGSSIFDGARLPAVPDVALTPTAGFAGASLPAASTLLAYGTMAAVSVFALIKVFKDAFGIGSDE